MLKLYKLRVDSIFSEDEDDTLHFLISSRSKF